MEAAQLQQWCKKELQQLLGTDIDGEVLKYLHSIESESSIEDYISGLFQELGHSGSQQQCKSFIREYLVRWRSLQADHEEIMVPLKRLGDDQLVLFEKKPKGSKKKKTVVPPKTPPPGFDRRPPSTATTSSTKYVPLLSNKGQGKLTISIPGRHPCQCLGQKHDLINNCMECGRIVCTQEGAGACLFCGNVVFTREDEQILSRDSKRAEKLREKMLTQYNIKESEARALNHSDNDFIKATEHKDKLVAFDRTSKKRTTVVDDESDYFQVDNQWLSDRERTALKKKEEELREKKYGSRMKNVTVTLDIAGRTVSQQDDRDIDLYIEDHVQEIIDPQSSQAGVSRFEVVQEGIFNPSIPVPPPVYYSKKERAKNLKSKVRIQQITRIQDRGLLEMKDEGNCLSMHQPWASLLVCGIKQFEGRSWYTSHRGKLWIASTAKVAERKDINQLEQHYSQLCKDEIEFPDSYPSGCLLGCVDVVDCLSQDECKTMYPECDSESDYVFVCENPQMLMIKIPIKGKHKIWRLEPELHKSAKRACQTYD